MVHAPRAEAVLLVGEEQIDLARRDLRERQRAERRHDDVLPDARLARAGPGLPQELLDPPFHQPVDRPAAIRQLQRIKPLSTAGRTVAPSRPRASSPGSCSPRSKLADPATLWIAHPQVPGAAFQVDRRHGYVALPILSKPGPPRARTMVSIALSHTQSTVLSRRRAAKWHHLRRPRVPPGDARTAAGSNRINPPTRRRPAPDASAFSRSVSRAIADAVPGGALSVRLLGLRNDHGRAGCLLFGSEEGFPKDPGAALQKVWCAIDQAGIESICGVDGVISRSVDDRPRTSSCSSSSSSSLRPSGRL